MLRRNGDIDQRLRSPLQKERRRWPLSFSWRFIQIYGTLWRTRLFFFFSSSCSQVPPVVVPWLNMVNWAVVFHLFFSWFCADRRQNVDRSSLPTFTAVAFIFGCFSSRILLTDSLNTASSILRVRRLIRCMKRTKMSFKQRRISESDIHRQRAYNFPSAIENQFEHHWSI